VPPVARGRPGIQCGGERGAPAGIAARRAARFPGERVGKVLDGVTCIRLDATITFAHSDKDLTEANFKGFGFVRCWPTAITRRAAGPDAAQRIGR
jgi:hypothetical protein